MAEDTEAEVHQRTAALTSKKTLLACYRDHCKAWAVLGVDLLLALDDQALANVLLGADRQRTERLLEGCDLLPAWKRQPSKVKSADLLVPELRCRMPEREERIRVRATSTLLTWWARSAEERLRPTSLWADIRGLDLPTSYARCRELLPSAAQDAHNALQARPRDGGAAERLFAVITEGTIRNWSDSDLRARAEREHLLAPTAKRSHAPEEVIDEVAEDVAAEVCNEAPSGGADTEVTPLPPEPPSPSSAQEPPSQPRDTSSGLAEIEASLCSCVEARAAMQSMLTANIGQLQTVVAHIQEAERNAAQVFDTFLRAHGLPEQPIPPNALVDRREALQFVNALHCSVQEKARHEAEALASRRKLLLEELQQLGLSLPPELAIASNEEELSAVRALLAPAIRVERAVRRSDGARVATLEGLEPRERIEVLHRLSTAGTVAPSDILASLVKDPTGLAQHEGARALLGAVVIQTLEASQALPAGTWPVVLQALVPEAAAALADLAVVEAGGDDHRLDPEGLAVFAGVRTSPDLKNLLQRFELRKLTPRQRIEYASALALERDLDTEIVDELATALFECGRYAECLALIVFGLHAGHESKLPESRVKDALVAVLVTHARSGPEVAPIIRALITDHRWLLAPGNVPALLYLADSIGEAEVLADAFPAELDEARRQRPALMELLFAPGRKAVPRVDIQAAQTALAEYRHDLEKRSCYSKWAPAAQYQDAFNEHLEEQLLALNRPERRHPSPDELITTAQTQRRLPPVEGRAMRAMRTYVEDQFKRLDTVRKALSPPWSTHTVEAELGLRARDLRADLETERHTKATTPALAHLYDVAKER